MIPMLLILEWSRMLSPVIIVESLVFPVLLGGG
jgi:hypothetical protein